MTEISTLTACAVLLVLSLFQILLVAGMPLGRFAWGGQHRVLPKNLRVASISSLFLYATFAAFILSKSGVVELIANDTIVSIGMWVFTAYFFLGVIMNAISRSKPERMLMTPAALILAILFLIVARS